MNSKIDISGGFACPIPNSEYEKILMAHGGGGTLSQQLLEKIFQPLFDNPMLNAGHDGAIFELNGVKLAFSTDSYVINPIFFPGGNIGELAVNGTVNDVAMCGAKPLFLSVGMIIEEGFPVEDLWKISVSMKQAAEKAGVIIVTGDTKVVERGKGDQVYINTAGIGTVYPNVDISPKRIQVGDKIILSGKIAQHGIAIMSAREGLEFETEITSDCAPLNGMIDSIFAITNDVHVLRDPTRGGISSALNEICKQSGLGIRIDEKTIPIDAQVRGACEILGLDPLYIANEGKLLVILPEAKAERVLSEIKISEYGRDAQIIGTVTKENPGRVLMTTTIGSSRVVDMISGEQLPRIC